ncbi:putative circumsporozoite protein-like [Cocos nucifera]|nr:putative circumsporozoite protein-like [Cocos nucifera]
MGPWEGWWNKGGRLWGHTVRGIRGVGAVIGEARPRWRAQSCGVGGTNRVGAIVEEAGPGWQAWGYGVGGIDGVGGLWKRQQLAQGHGAGGAGKVGAAMGEAAASSRPWCKRLSRAATREAGSKLLAWGSGVGDANGVKTTVGKVRPGLRGWGSLEGGGVWVTM